MPISAEELKKGFEIGDKIFDTMTPQQQLESLHRASPPLPDDHPWHAMAAEFKAEEANRAEALRRFAKEAHLPVAVVEQWIKQICPAYEPPQTD